MATLTVAEHDIDGTQFGGAGSPRGESREEAFQKPYTPWHAEEQRWADRLGFLVARDPVAVLQAIAPDPAQLRHSQRAAELLRWLATDTCWRTYTRLSQS